MEITVNRPAAEVWKRIGKYCDVSEWLQIPAGCKITSGTDSEFGAVRTVGAEVLVGRTELSYTYAQTPKEGTIPDSPSHHGTGHRLQASDHFVVRYTAEVVFRGSLSAIT
jgi:hypothetical protein